MLKWRIHFFYQVIAFVCLFIQCSHYAKATPWIKLNIDECANCTNLFEALNNAALTEKVIVVLPKHFYDSDNDVKDKFSFKKYPNLTLLYNDSVFNHFNEIGKSSSSEFFITNTKEHVLYSSDLRSIDMKIVLYFLHFDKPRSFDFKGININSLYLLRFDRKFILAQDHFNRLFMMDVLTQEFNKIELDDQAIYRMYEKYYADSFRYKFPIIESIMNETPSFKPRLEFSYLIANPSEMLILYTMNDYKYLGGVDTGIYGHSIIAKYNLLDKKFTNFYVESGQLKAAYSESIGIAMDKLFKFDNRLFGLFSQPNNREAFTISYPLILDNETGQFKLIDEPIKNAFPSDYYKKIDYGYRFGMNTSSSGIVYLFADSLYDGTQKLKIKIPYSTPRIGIEDFTVFLNEYNSSTKCYHIIYIQNGSDGYYHMVFDKKSNRVSNDIIIPPDKSSLSHTPLDFVHPYQLIYIDKKENKLKTLDL